VSISLRQFLLSWRQIKMPSGLPPRDCQWQDEKYLLQDEQYTRDIEKDRYGNPRDYVTGGSENGFRSNASFIWLTINTSDEGPCNSHPVGICRIDPEGILKYLHQNHVPFAGFDDRPEIVKAINEKYPYCAHHWNPSRWDKETFDREGLEDENLYSSIFSNGPFQNARSAKEIERILFMLAWEVRMGCNIGIMAKVALEPGEDWSKYKSAQIIQSNDLFVVANLDDSRSGSDSGRYGKKVRTFTLPRLRAVCELGDRFGLRVEKCILFESGSGFRYAFFLFRKVKRVYEFDFGCGA